MKKRDLNDIQIAVLVGLIIGLGLMVLTLVLVAIAPSDFFNGTTLIG